MTPRVQGKRHLLPLKYKGGDNPLPNRAEGSVAKTDRCTLRALLVHRTLILGRAVFLARWKREFPVDETKGITETNT